MQATALMMVEDNSLLDACRRLPSKALAGSGIPSQNYTQSPVTLRGLRYNMVAATCIKECRPTPTIISQQSSSENLTETFGSRKSYSNTDPMRLRTSSSAQIDIVYTTLFDVSVIHYFAYFIC